VRVPMLEKALTRMLFRSPRSTAPSHTDTCAERRCMTDMGEGAADGRTYKHKPECPCLLGLH